MKVISILAILVLVSCKNNDNEVSQYSQEKFDSIVDSNSEEFMFLRFYPEMDSDVYDRLLKQYILEGTIYEKKYSEGWSTENYVIKVNNEDLSFQLYYNPYYMNLSNHGGFKSTSPVSEYLIESEMLNYHNRLDSLVQFFQKKYGSPVEQKNFENKSVLKLINENKILIITGEGNPCQYCYSTINGINQYSYFNYEIDLKIYTKKSFQDLRNREVTDSINHVKRYNEKVRIKREKEKMENEKKLNDF